MTDSSFPARRAGMLALPEPDIPIAPSATISSAITSSAATSHSTATSHNTTRSTAISPTASPATATPATLDAVRERIHRDINPQIQILLRPHGHQVILDLIQVPYPLRGQRLADRALDLLCRRADSAGWEIALEPHPAFGSDTGRLAAWYRAHGFRPEAPGENAWMHRPPRFAVAPS
ncbi:hypothetical protein [Mycetocola sp. JXN-3]|uniref:hypothetical protein n=1 Tax=Mycetocola sp. JXN-3 TaxID=2116510 RepID=UPI00165D15DE|nr:hypothetical protein [Mycetocola sp. JXN-3]